MAENAPNQLTDGGPSVTLELSTGVAGPPFGGAHWAVSWPCGSGHVQRSRRVRSASAFSPSSGLSMFRTERIGGSSSYSFGNESQPPTCSRIHLLYASG